MEQITLIKRNGTQIKLFSKEPFRTVKTATQSKSLMGVDTVTLSILTREILSFDKGDRITVKGENYYIRTKVNRELTSDGYFKYDAVFYGVLYDLMKTAYRDMDSSGNSTTSTFDLVYDLKEYIRVLIYNINHDYPGWWTFDETGCPDKNPIPLQFSCNNCLEVLQQVCQKFKVDFRITQSTVNNATVRTIKIGSFGSVITPPDGSSYFEWGRGKGLYSLKENKVDDKAIKTRLWVEGGTSNLPKGYRNYAMRLQLPARRLNRNAHTLSDGTVISAGSEYIGISSESERYIEDSSLSQTLGVDADSVLYDEIVPTRTGTVTAIYTAGDNPDYLSFADSSMDFDINTHLVNNVSAKVTFITGKLAGQELEISKYDNTTKKFTLIPYQDSRGLTIPTEDSAAFRIAVGNKYKLTDIVMPDSVIDNAEEDLWYAGYDDLCKLKQARVQYSMELNRMKLLEDMPTDSDTVLFKPGDYVPIKDTRFGVQKNIRIQKVERNLLLRHDYHLTISDTATIDVITQSVVDTQNHEVIIINNQLRDLTKKRRGWRTTEELRNMVFDTDGYFDTDNFKANSIDTNMLTVGSKSQQFVLSGVVIQPNYGGNANRIVISAGSLVHLTINENSARLWNLTASDTTMGNTTGYYLYARCAKSGNNGIWLVTQTRYQADPGGDYYYFLVGIIGSAYDASGGHTAYRDFTTTYGFTRINGNTITTGKIVTDDGYNYLDLDGNKFRIGDANSSLDYNVTANNQLTLFNVKLKSGSGDVSDIGVYRGVYNPNYIYYKGDEVSYTSSGYTATYRYINPTPSRGHAPTDTAYWDVVSKGADGTTEEKVFQRTKVNIRPDAPGNSQSDGYIPTGWTAAPVGVNAEYPFEWVSVRKKNAGTWGNFETPTIWNVYGQAVNNNLLNQTEFESAEKLDKWHIRSYYSNKDGYDYQDNVSDHIAQKYKDGYNAYYDTCIYSSTYINYKEILAQYVWKKDGSIKTLENSKWYTLSFWARNYGSKLNVYLYTGVAGEYAYDSNESIYVDGIEVKTNGQNVRPDGTVMSNPKFSRPGSDMCVSFDSGSELVKHTITFKTRSAYNSSYRFSTDWVEFLFRLLPPTSYGNINICMIKLEEGMTDTAYIPSSVDLHNFYYEYRFAKNGSTSVAPDLNKNVANPSGWSTTQPTVSQGEFLWRIIGKKNSDGTLAEAWSDPIRITPYDGVNGKSPVLVFRGNFDGTKTYYGTQYRVDAVKYNGSYYICRIDAGSFTGSSYIPTNTDKWNTFGAEFESIATNLLLAEGASIGNWWHSGGKIVSTLGTGNKIELDASTPRIYIESATSGGDYSEDTSMGSKIELNASEGIVRVEAKNRPSYSTGTSYMSPTGIFANLAGTQAVSTVTGYTRKAAMVALGYGNLAKSSWGLNNDEAMLAGVYGVANNSNGSPAPAYGGFFYDLKACGLILKTRYIGDSSSGNDLYIPKSVSQVISVTNSGTRKNVYLPNDGYDGRVIFFHQQGGGGLRVYPQSGQHIYDDTSENSYYDIDEGRTLMAIFGVWYKNNVRTEVWTVRVFKY